MNAKTRIRKKGLSLHGLQSAVCSLHGLRFGVTGWLYQVIRFQRFSFFSPFYSVAARFRHYTAYMWFKNKENTSGTRIVTKGNAKCNFKTRSEPNKTPNFCTKTKQTFQVFPNTSNEKTKESHTSDTTLIANELENSDLVLLSALHNISITGIYGFVWRQSFTIALTCIALKMIAFTTKTNIN